MIVTRTPLRISFIGGGTDLPSFYQLDIGAVVSATIDKYMVVVANQKFDGKLRLSYTQTENVDDPDDLEHDIVRNAIKLLHVDLSNGLEIATLSDVPARGTGLGSSSALAVGLILALSSHFKTRKGDMAGLSQKEWLAQKACELEINLCKKPIGKQDQYAAAFGGINLFRFYPDGQVEVMPAANQVRLRERFRTRLLLFSLGSSRGSDEILKRQRELSKDRFQLYRKMAALAEEFYGYLSEDDRMDDFGELLDENWSYKRELAPGITTPEIDELYAKAKILGASGGKVLGAGGGGFLLLAAPEDRHREIISKIGLRNVEFNFVRQGAHSVFG